MLLPCLRSPKGSKRDRSKQARRRGGEGRRRGRRAEARQGPARWAGWGAAGQGHLGDRTLRVLPLPCLRVLPRMTHFELRLRAD